MSRSHAVHQDQRHHLGAPLRQGDIPPLATHVMILGRCQHPREATSRVCQSAAYVSAILYTGFVKWLQIVNRNRQVSMWK